MGIEILGFYHAATHLNDTPDAVHGAEIAYPKALIEPWKTTFKEDPKGGEKVIGAVLYRRDPVVGSARRTLAAVAGYLFSRQNDMDYHAYR